MSSIYIGKNLRKFESAPQFAGITKVVLTVSDDVKYSAGTDTGRTLELFNPWGTQQHAEDILALVKGYAYQPYSAAGAIVDAAAELGDAVTVNGVYGGVYSLKRKFGSLYSADLNAPSDEEIDHEYPYKSPQDRTVTRQFRNVRTSLSIQDERIGMEIDDRKSDVEKINTALDLQNGLIAAKVSKTGGTPSSFGWELDEASWTLRANNAVVLQATKSGLDITGKITATSGKIGGFDITQNYLSYNGQTWGGTNTTGIYMGPSGIQLGKNFKVDASGNLSAASGTFSGYVKAGSIQYGGDSGYLDGSGLVSHSVYGSQIGYNTISTAYTSGGINTSLGYADYANGVFNGWNRPSIISAYRIALAGYDLVRTSISYKDGNGNTRSLNVVGWQ